MATLFPYSPKQLAWVDSKSPALKALIEKKPFNLLYRYRPTGVRALLISYSGDGSAVDLAITGDYNAAPARILALQVDPDDLEECDLPDPDRFLGASLTEPAEVFAAVGDLVRAMS